MGAFWGVMLVVVAGLLRCHHMVELRECLVTFFFFLFFPFFFFFFFDAMTLWCRRRTRT